MAVSISNLSKSFGKQCAVDGISFDAKPGGITGFLGPNGAGKSTTMKIATGFLRPDSGSVRIEDIDVVEHPIKAKRMIGYLAEHNPLYLDMYVREFLGFIAGAYGLKNARKQVEDVIELVGLTRESDKKLRTLSKGYRQRVGLAKALIHDPSVLILDEPTSGLDPNQIVEIRKVIKAISLEKTVILSTHIMQEVDAICDQVVIINQGKLVANDRLDVLKSGLKDSTGMIITFESSVDPGVFIEAGLEATQHGTNAYFITSDKDDLRAEILRITTEQNLPLVSLTKAQRSLEEIFQGLTQQKES